MSDENISQAAKTPGWFWALSGLALVWNLLGVMAFFLHINLTPEILAQMPEAERALYENSPGWMAFVFAAAVFGGALGCVALLLRKGWAFPLFAISLIGVLIQNGYSFFMTNAIEVMGAQAVVMPLIVVLIAIGLLWFTKAMKDKQVIL